MKKNSKISSSKTYSFKKLNLAKTFKVKVYSSKNSCVKDTTGMLGSNVLDSKYVRLVGKEYVDEKELKVEEQN